jgi:hypothetical protein
MMNWKGFRKKRPWINCKALYRHSPGGSEENHEKPFVRITDLRAEI